MYIAIYMIVELCTYSKALKSREETPLPSLMQDASLLQAGCRCKIKSNWFISTYIHTPILSTKKAQGNGLEWKEQHSHRRE